MGRARLDGDVPLGCIRPSVRTLNSGSPSRVDISVRSRRSSLAGGAARILAAVIPPKSVDRGPTTDVNRGAQDELDINCGWNGQRLRKSTSVVDGLWHDFPLLEAKPNLPCRRGVARTDRWGRAMCSGCCWGFTDSIQRCCYARRQSNCSGRRRQVEPEDRLRRSLRKCLENELAGADSIAHA
jgi:hypothetical protein